MGQTRQAVTIALDSTKLLGADSYLFQSRSGAQDPSARHDFKDVVDAFCNPTDLEYLSPPTIPDRPTPLLKVYSSAAKPLVLERDSYRASGLEDAYREMATSFHDLAREDGKLIANWLRFQMEDETLDQIFWRAGNTEEHLRLAKLAIEHLSWENTTLYRELTNKPLNIVGDFIGATETLHFTRLWIGLAYAYHAFAKGRVYAQQILDGPAYIPHWLRITAFPSADDAGVNFRSPMAIHCFPWGDLLQTLNERRTLPILEDESRAIETLEHIRSFSILNQPRNLAEMGEDVLVDYALSALKEAGWLPPATQGASIQRVTGLIRRALRLPGLLRECVTGTDVPGARFIGFLVKELDVGGWLERQLVHLETRRPLLRIESLAARRKDRDILRCVQEYRRRI